MASDIRLGGAYVVFRAQDTAFVRRLRNAGNRLDSLRRSVDQVRDSVVRYNAVSRLFSRGFLPLFGAYGILAAARQFQELSDTMLLAQARLRLVSRSTEEAVRAQQRLFQVAQQTRQDFSGLVAVYARFGRATRQLGLSSDLLLQFVENISQAIIISGATVKEANAGLIQLSQALAIGVLRGDELRATMEQLPRVMLAVADGLGTTIGALRTLSEAGLLTSGVVIRGILNQTQELRDEFRQIPVTIEGALLRIRNSISRTISELNTSEGVAQSLVDSINRLRVVLEDPAIIRGFTETVSGLANALAFLIQNFSQVAEVGAALVGTLLLLSTRFGRTGAVARTFAATTQFIGIAMRSLVSDIQLFYQRTAGQSILDSLVGSLRRAAATTARFRFSFRESLNNIQTAARSFATDFRALWRPFNDVLERSFSQFRNLFAASRQTFRSILRETQSTSQATTAAARDLGTGLSTIVRSGVPAVQQFTQTFQQNFARVNTSLSTFVQRFRRVTPEVVQFGDELIRAARRTRAGADAINVSFRDLGTGLSTIVRSGIPAIQRFIRSAQEFTASARSTAVAVQRSFVPALLAARVSLGAFVRTLAASTLAVGIAGVVTSVQSLGFILRRLVFTVGNARRAFFVLSRVLRFSLAVGFGAATTAARLFAFSLLRVGAALVGIVRSVARIAASFVVVEGVFQLIRALFELNSVAEDLGLTFSQLAGILGIELLRTLQRVGRAILAFIARLSFAIGQRLQQAFEGTAFQQLGDRIGGVFTRAGASLARALNDSDVDQLSDSLLERLDVTPEQRNQILANLQRILKERIEDVKNTFTSGFKEVEDAAQETFDRVNAINLGPGGLGQANAFELVEDLRDRLNSEFIQFERQIQQRRAAVTLNRPQALVANLQLRQEARIREFLAEQQRALVDLAKQELDIRNQLAQTAENQGIGSLDFAEQSRALQQLINARNVAREQVTLINEQLVSIRQRNEAQRESILIQAQELIRAEDLRRAAEGISRAFGEFASSAIANFNDIGEAARNLAQTILNELLQVLAIRPLTNFLSPIIGGFLGIGTAATGGLRNGLTLVGERGPELIDFQRPGQVYSTEQLQEALNAGRSMASVSGITVQLTQNIQSTDGPGVRAALAESVPVIQTEVMAGVVEAIGRPSPMRTAILTG